MLPKLLDISYRKENEFLSVNLKNDSLPNVAKSITQKSGKNVIVSPQLKDTKVTGYFQNRPFKDVMEMIGQANGLLITQNENGSFFIEKDNQKKQGANGKNSKSTRKKSKSKRGEKGYYELSLSKKGFLSVKSYDGNVADMLMEAAEKLNLNYYLYTIPDDKVTTTIIANEITFDDFLYNSFKGSDYTYNKDSKGFYFIARGLDTGSSEASRKWVGTKIFNQRIFQIEFCCHCGMKKWVGT